MTLLAKRRGSTWWRSADTGVTGVGGYVRLATNLRASSRLRLRHPLGAILARDVEPNNVVVAKRLSRSVSATRSRAGMAVGVTGRVAPAQPVGAPVVLQRRVDGQWRRVEAGRMTTRRAYRIRWTPQRAGSSVLRVRRDGDHVRAAGVSSPWRQVVAPESAADVAQDIRRNNRITLATVHLSAGRDGATPLDNVADAANGRPVRTSCVGTAPCRSTNIDIRVLRAIRAMGMRNSVTVSEIAGGSHAAGSAHYRGRGVDITWVGGRHVGYGSNYGMAVRVCKAHGATEVFSPGHDPWGGHSTHVHCGWE